MAMSLAELDAQTQKTDITGGDGNQKPEDLEAARQKQQQQAQDEGKDKGGDGNQQQSQQQSQQQNQAQNQQQQKTPEELAAEKEAADQQRLADLKAKPAANLTPDEKAELEKLEKEQAPEEEGDEAIAFWEDVDKLSGDPLGIKWDEIKDEAGQPVDPLSPRGVLIREQAVADRAAERFEQYIATEYPRAYRYLLHSQAGGTDEEFFNQKTTSLPDYEQFKESVDLQTKFYEQRLIRTGLTADQAKMLVDAAVKDKKITELADKAYKDDQKAEQDSIEALRKQVEAQEKTYQDQVTALDKLLATEASSTNLQIVVPEGKKAAFLQYIRGRVEYNDRTGQFMFAQPITREALPRMLEAMYVQFAGGNFNEIVQREAMTQNARRLRRAVDKSKDPLRTQPDTSKQKKTLSEI